MNFLPSQLNASNRPVIVEAALQILDGSLAFMLTPSIDTSANPNAPTIALGAPTAGPATGGAWVVGALWVDAALAVWRCTVAGTPGTWVQQSAASVSADPAGPPAGYVIARQVEHLKLYYWSGAAWTAV